MVERPGTAGRRSGRPSGGARPAATAEAMRTGQADRAAAADRPDGRPDRRDRDARAVTEPDDARPATVVWHDRPAPVDRPTRRPCDRGTRHERGPSAATGDRARHRRSGRPPWARPPDHRPTAIDAADDRTADRPAVDRPRATTTAARAGPAPADRAPGWTAAARHGPGHRIGPYRPAGAATPATRPTRRCVPEGRSARTRSSSPVGVPSRRRSSRAARRSGCSSCPQRRAALEQLVLHATSCGSRSSRSRAAR